MPARPDGWHPQIDLYYIHRSTQTHGLLIVLQRKITSKLLVIWLYRLTVQIEQWKHGSTRSMWLDPKNEEPLKQDAKCINIGGQKIVSTSSKSRNCSSRETECSAPFPKVISHNKCAIGYSPLLLSQGWMIECTTYAAPSKVFFM